MYNVMIVEDEMLVRLGFKNSVCWEKYGMTVCADVTNGEEAWEYYTNIAKPDLIITDLKMPVMDGMELIRRIREHDSETRIVILSCLEDFDLIRQAMKMDVSNYILKLSMTDEEIDEVLSRTSEELSARQTLETSKGIIRNPFSLKETIIKDFLFYQLYSEEEFIQHIANLKLQLKPERLITVLMEIDQFELVQAKFKDDKGDLIRVTIMNVLNELLSSSQRGEVVSDDEARYLFILSFHDVVSESHRRDEIQGILLQVQRVLSRFFNISVTFGISGIRNDFRSLRTLYRESIEAINEKFFIGLGGLIFHTELDPDRSRNLVKVKLKKLGEQWGDREKFVQDEIESVVQAYVATSRKLKVHDFKHLFIRLMHAPSLTASMLEAEVTSLDAEFGEAVQRCETFDALVGVFNKRFEEFVALKNKKKRLSKEIAKAVQYIQENYASDVSLQDLAEQLELTPNYLSALFKKEMEQSFSEYLNRIRLERAKDLLLTTNLKSYEIAERTGFSDDSYFSRAFKKYVGVRPNGFRRLWVNDQLR